MKQILQNPRTGTLELVEVPAPAPGRGQLLVRNAFSVVSPGTEKLARDFARKSLLGKARSRPDLVRQVTRKLQQEGPLATYRAVTSRLEAPQPLGYSSAGIVESVGGDVSTFSTGDRVACAGAGYACHAELIVVPSNLAALVPDQLPLQYAAFATIGAIALQGLRVAGPTLGELVAVIGLGPIGQLTVQLLRANGCRILAIDPDPERVNQALHQGADWGAAPTDDLEPWKTCFTAGYGADIAIVTASSETASPLRLAVELCRLKGRIALVGAVPIEIDRRLLYQKELDVRMSTSYGPGRYDRTYEEEGLDYPLPWVRWTEARNLKAFISLTARGDIRLDRLDIKTAPFDDAVLVYDELARRRRRTLVTLFRYPDAPNCDRTLRIQDPPRYRVGQVSHKRLGIAFLGAGAYARSVLLPILARRRDARPVSLVTATGASAQATARKFGFERCGTDAHAVLADPDVDVVFVATRHDTHAELAESALRAGKAVWLEKPVGLTPREVDRVLAAAEETQSPLFVGYNRRFSPHTRAIRHTFAARRGPLTLHFRISAGPPPSNTWIMDPKIGGGRIIGEMCHFVDFCSCVVGSPPIHVISHSLSRDPRSDDSIVALLRYPDRSVAVIEYLARSSRTIPKERIEISGDGITAVCENFRTTSLHGRRQIRSRRQDKGQSAGIDRLLDTLRSHSESPWSSADIRSVSDVTFRIARVAN